MTAVCEYGVYIDVLKYFRITDVTDEYSSLDCVFLESF